MNLEALKQQKEAKLAELQALEEQIKEAEMRRPFSPTSGGVYYFLNSDGSIQNDTWYGATGKNSDCGRRGIGNCFKNAEAAQKFCDFLCLLAELKEYADKVNEGWKPDWSTIAQKFFIEITLDQNTFEINSYTNYQSSVLPLFVSESAASSAIAHFGDRLKLLFEYYNS